MTASKHFAPPIHIQKTSKNDPEEKPEQSGLNISRMKGAKGYLSDFAWDHSVPPTTQLCIKTAKLSVNAREQCKEALKAQFSEKCNCKQMEEVFSNYTVSTQCNNL